MSLVKRLGAWFEKPKAAPVAITGSYAEWSANLQYGFRVDASQATAICEQAVRGECDWFSEPFNKTDLAFIRDCQNYLWQQRRDWR